MAGRTPVPERESIASLAAHGATMVIFLSAGMLEGLSTELLKGAYTPDTPAALVYKATWPEEKVVRCTVAPLLRRGESIRSPKPPWYWWATSCPTAISAASSTPALYEFARGTALWTEAIHEAGADRLYPAGQ